MWPFDKKEQRNTTETQPLSLVLEQQSYCDLVNKQTEFLRKLKNIGKIDPMSISAIFAAVNMISNAIAQMPWILKYDNIPQFDTFIDNLTYDTNTTQFMLVKNIVKDMLIYGNGFAYIIRDEAGRPVTLKYIPYNDCSIQYNQLTDTLYYRIPKIKSGYIEPINVIHLVMHSKNGVQGRSVLDFAHSTIKLASNTDKAALEYFENGMSVQGIIKSPNILPQQKRDQIRKGWREVDGSFRILEGGLEYQQIQSNSREAELIQNRSFNLLEIARFFNINPILLGDLSHTQYGSIEMAQQEFVVHTLAPYVIMLEQELNRKLIFESDRKFMYIDIDEEAIVKMDKQSLVNTVTALVDKGVMTRNEARLKLGLPESDDELADKLVITYTSTESGKNDTAEDEDTQKDEDTQDEEK